MDLFPFTAALFGRDTLLEASACTTSSSVFLARNCSTGTLQAARFGEDFFVQRKVDTGYLGPKTPATHLAGASKQGIQRPLPTYFPFRQKQLGSLNEFISARLQPVETFGLLYSRHQKNESRNQRRQMCQHNFSARLTH